MSDTTIHIFKANPLRDEVVPTLTIVCDQAIDDAVDYSTSGWEARRRSVYREQARGFVNALGKHIPGGLMDHIFAELALRKASVMSLATDREAGQ